MRRQESAKFLKFENTRKVPSTSQLKKKIVLSNKENIKWEKRSKTKPIDKPANLFQINQHSRKNSYLPTEQKQQPKSVLKFERTRNTKSSIQTEKVEKEKNILTDWLKRNSDISLANTVKQIEFEKIVKNDFI